MMSQETTRVTQQHAHDVSLPGLWPVLIKRISVVDMIWAKLRDVLNDHKHNSYHNSLPDAITSASSLRVFRQKLKTHLFRHLYPDIIM